MTGKGKTRPEEVAVRRWKRKSVEEDEELRFDRMENQDQKRRWLGRRKGKSRTGKEIRFDRKLKNKRWEE